MHELRSIGSLKICAMKLPRILPAKINYCVKRVKDSEKKEELLVRFFLRKFEITPGSEKKKSIQLQQIRYFQKIDYMIAVW